MRILSTIVLLTVIILICPDTLRAQDALPDLARYAESILLDEEEKPIRFPSFVLVDPVMKEVYVAMSRRIIIYTFDFFPLFTLDERDGVETPQGLTMDTEGNLYVVQGPSNDNPKHRISVFNARLKWERDIYIEGIERSEDKEPFHPYRLAIDSKGNILVTANPYPGVVVIDREGKVLDIFSPEEAGKKVRINFVQARGGYIFLVSEQKGRIYVYDEEREFLFRFGEKGGSSGKLSRPKSVDIDIGTGRIYVVDYMRHAVNIYDISGTFLSEFGGMGWGPGWFQFPRHVAVDSLGRILVVDTFNNRVEVFYPVEVEGFQPAVD